MAKRGRKPGRKSAAAKEAKAAKAQPAEQTPTREVQLIAASALKTLINKCKRLRKDMDSVNGELRSEIAYHVEKSNLHKSAFALCRKLDGMEAGKAADFWDHLQAYLDMSGVMAKIETVQLLPLPEQESDDESTEDENTNVSRLQFGGQEAVNG